MSGGGNGEFSHHEVKMTDNGSPANTRHRSSRQNRLQTKDIPLSKS
jgi:hypothetical protein